MRKRILNVLWRGVRCLLIAYLVVLLLMMMLERHLIYFPSVYPEGEWNAEAIGAEDAFFEAADGVKLHGWYVEHPQPRAHVLFLHGNAGNLTHRDEMLVQWRDQRRCSVFIVDYRGYGRSEGAPSEAGVLADGRAARAWLAQRAGIAEEQVVLLGRSLGGGVAVDMAAADGARAVILESTFTSLPDIAARSFPFLPVRLLMRNRLDSLSKIGDYHGPLLQSHSVDDEVIPYDLGARLFEAANEPKQFIEMQGRGHNDRPTREYKQALDAFLDSLP